MIPRLGILLAVLFSPTLLACDCLWQGAFSEVHGNADLLAQVEITARKGNSADLNLVQTFAGKEHNTRIRLWADSGALCRPNIDEFPVGSQWVMALQRIEQPPDDAFNPFKPNISFGRKGDYYLSSCGVNWLPVKSGRVSGNILSATRWQYLDPKKTPVILPLFIDWLSGNIDDATLAEAARPQAQSRQLLNDTKMFLWQLERERREAE
ncbi:hypothetical protein [Spongiibacter sp.]|uniref:hypothetical protein n=1 Tax=Spongiibacter sp. TaxID=2024860 RepID=UPI00356A8060